MAVVYTALVGMKDDLICDSAKADFAPCYFPVARIVDENDTVTGIRLSGIYDNKRAKYRDCPLADAEALLTSHGYPAFQLDAYLQHIHLATVKNFIVTDNHYQLVPFVAGDSLHAVHNSKDIPEYPIVDGDGVIEFVPRSSLSDYNIDNILIAGDSISIKQPNIYDTVSNSEIQVLISGSNVSRSASEPEPDELTEPEPDEPQLNIAVATNCTSARQIAERIKAGNFSLNDMQTSESTKFIEGIEYFDRYDIWSKSEIWPAVRAERIQLSRDSEYNKFVDSLSASNPNRVLFILRDIATQAILGSVEANELFDELAEKSAYPGAIGLIRMTS